MAKQPQEDYSIKEAVYQNALARKQAMVDLAERSSKMGNQQIRPDSTPSGKTGSWDNPNGKLSEPVRERLGIQPEPEQGKPKASLEDVKNIGQSLKAQNVTTNADLTQESKAKLENSFDKNTQKSSTNSQEKPLSQTETIRQQAKQDIKNQPGSLKSQQWER